MEILKPITKQMVGDKLMRTDIGYLSAKLEEIHFDVKQLQAHVDELRQAAAGRKVLSKFLVGFLGVAGLVTGWAISLITGIKV